MPALNIDFTDTELARLRERARTRGTSMRTMAHDTIVSCTRQDSEDDEIMDAYARNKTISRDLLRRLADR